MSYLEKAKRVLDQQPPVVCQPGCRCGRLNARGVAVLRCPVCGYAAAPADSPERRGAGQRTNRLAPARRHFPPPVFTHSTLEPRDD